MANITIEDYNRLISIFEDHHNIFNLCCSSFFIVKIFTIHKNDKSFSIEGLTLKILMTKI